MRKGTRKESERVYDLLRREGVASLSVNTLKLKTENERRSKSLDVPYLQTKSAYDAIFEQTTTLGADRPTTPVAITGSITLQTKTTGPHVGVPDGEILLASAVKERFPNDCPNRNPSMVLAITEWIVEDILMDTHTFGHTHLYPGVYPIVSRVADDEFVFTMHGQPNDKAKIETEMWNKFGLLFDRMLSGSLNLKVHDLFANPGAAIALRYTHDPFTLLTVPSAWGTAWKPPASLPIIQQFASTDNTVGSVDVVDGAGTVVTTICELPVTIDGSNITSGELSVDFTFEEKPEAHGAQAFAQYIVRISVASTNRFIGRIVHSSNDSYLLRENSIIGAFQYFTVGDGPYTIRTSPL
jgi:hypothetical protein